jgi:hypothetical protein
MRQTTGSELDEPMPNRDSPEAGSPEVGSPRDPGVALRPPGTSFGDAAPAAGSTPPWPAAEDVPEDLSERPPAREVLLRRIALGEVVLVPEVVGDADGLAPGLPDQRTRALARLGALLAADPVGPPLRQTVADALAASVTRDEVVGVLVSLIPTIGVARAAAVAPELGLAIGYDVGAALELSIPARPAR